MDFGNLIKNLLKFADLTN